MMRRACTHTMYLHIKPIICMRILLSFTTATVSSCDLVQPADSQIRSVSLDVFFQGSKSQLLIARHDKEIENIAMLCTRKQLKDANLDIILSCLEVQLV